MSEFAICQLITTGGTIAMRVDPLIQAPVPALSGDDLLSGVQGLAAVARLDVQNLFNVPSDHMGPERWIVLHRAVIDALNREEIAGVIVSHGTDTLEETAWFLDLTILSAKPVVLVGAQRNASSPDSDGPRNLLNAARVCVSASARDQGVLVVMNNQINAARDVAKTHTSDVEAFKSGDFGFIGVVDDDRVVLSRTPLRRQHVPLRQGILPRVDIVTMYCGADGKLLQAALIAGAKGIVVQGLGCGNVNVEMYEAICQAIMAGVRVVISTRVQRGRVRPVYGFAGGGKTLKDAGAIFADDLSPQKSRILLMLALQASKTPAEIQQMFNQ